MTQTSTTPERELEAVASLEGAGRFSEAVALLQQANRARRSPVVEERLVRLRHSAGKALESGGGLPEWPRDLPDPFPGVDGPPEATPGELTPELVGGAVLHHGCLLVRGLADEATVERLVDDTDRAWEARDRFFDGVPRNECGPAFVPFRTGDDDKTLTFRRKWVRDGGAVWVADSPPAFFDVMEFFEGTGLIDVISGYLGERPALTVNKFTLRKVPPETTPSWHQDGAFMGEGLRTLNVWVALSDCGGDSPLPALDIVPKRFDAVLETGTEGARLDAEVGEGVVAREAADVGVLRPVFAAGDALIFDEVFLHRTATDAGMVGDRYALESWFFAPSRFPSDYVPLAV